MYFLASYIKDTQQTVIFSYLLIEIRPCFIAFFNIYIKTKIIVSKDSNEFFPDK